ncbi:hypothetical protein MHEL_46160 [Mycolicibacterium helvum]|uniref:Uncharacterized protein n=1 Tax=Mycolicibacterium helvum TaxID=1534349 RepID=A0A7I7TCA7_9MYCO|nr:hypothetical protein MHEL_46160 [Mycolicibacterium helvum]
MNAIPVIRNPGRKLQLSLSEQLVVRKNIAVSEPSLKRGSALCRQQSASLACQGGSDVRLNSGRQLGQICAAESTLSGNDKPHHVSEQWVLQRPL